MGTRQYFNISTSDNVLRIPWHAKLQSIKIFFSRSQNRVSKLHETQSSYATGDNVVAIRKEPDCRSTCRICPAPVILCMEVYSINLYFKLLFLRKFCLVGPARLFFIVQNTKQSNDFNFYFYNFLLFIFIRTFSIIIILVYPFLSSVLFTTVPPVLYSISILFSHYGK